MIFEQIQKLAIEKNISIAELERQSGLSNGAIGKWRTVMPNAGSLLAVAKVLNVSIEQLVDEKE